MMDFLDYFFVTSAATLAALIGGVYYYCEFFRKKKSEDKVRQVRKPSLEQSEKTFEVRKSGCPAGETAKLGQYDTQENHYSSSTFAGTSERITNNHINHAENFENFDPQSCWPLESKQKNDSSSLDEFVRQEELVNQNAQSLQNGEIVSTSGQDPSAVSWINDLLRVVLGGAGSASSKNYAPILCECIQRSLNEKLSDMTNSSPQLCDLIVEVRRIRWEESSRPELSDLITELEQDKTIRTTGKIFERLLVMDLSIRQAPLASSSTYDDPSASTLMSSNSDTSDLHACLNYELAIENLEGQLKFWSNPNGKTFFAQFANKPQCKLSLKAKYVPNAIRIINEDTLISMTVQSMTQTLVDFYYGDDSDFPTFRANLAGSGGTKHKLSQIGRNFKQDILGAINIQPSSGSKERKLIVKLIRATNVQLSEKLSCLMELDAPRKIQHSSSKLKPGPSAHWDETYIFELSDKSQQLQLELWDSSSSSDAASSNQQVQNHSESQKPTLSQRWHLNQALGQQHETAKLRANLTSSGKLVGVARVQLAPLKQNPTQKVNLQLAQSLEQLDNKRQQTTEQYATDDNVASSELLVELTYVEHAATQSINRSASGVSLISSEQNGTPNILQNSDSQQLRLERHFMPSGYLVTSATITNCNEVLPVEDQTQSGLTSLRSQSPVSEAPTTTELGCDSQSDWTLSRPATAEPTESGEQEEFHRTRSKSRTLIRAIKKRFSFSRKRSKSIGGSGSPSQEVGSLQLRPDSKSVASSTDLASLSDQTRAKSVSGLREPSELPRIVINKHQGPNESMMSFEPARSLLVFECLELVDQSPASTSDISGPAGTAASSWSTGLNWRRKSEAALHSSSGRNQQHPVIKYYAIESDDQARKWRKRALCKLHLFNEHQFVAKHLPGSSACHNCGRVFSRSVFGKQGYQCRNCELLAHKECHAKVEHQCPHKPAGGLQLERTDRDPPPSLSRSNSLRSLAMNRRELHSQQQARSPKLTSKSVSLEES